MRILRSALGGVLLALGIASAIAAVTPNSPVTPQTPDGAGVQFLQGTDAAGTYKTVYIAGANGSDCNGLWLTTNDGTATHLVTVQVVNGFSGTGSIAASTASGTGSITGTVLNLTAISSGNFIPGGTLSGTNVSSGTQIVNQINGNPGGVGNYNVTVASTAASTTISETYGTMTTTAITGGSPAIGDYLAGANVAANTVVIGYGTGGAGTTGIGTFFVSPTQTAASATISSGGALQNGIAGIKLGGTVMTTVLNAGFASASAGTNTPAMNLFSPVVWPGLPLSSDNNPFLRLLPGQSVQATYASALTAGTLINLVSSCAAY